MVTAILPSLTDDSTNAETEAQARYKILQSVRNSAAFSVNSELTITPERYTRSVSTDRNSQDTVKTAGRPSALAGYVGLFTGCGALVALVLFLPLPARFGGIDGVTPAEAVSYSFYVVSGVSLVVAVFVSFGLRNLKGEEGKGWKLLFGRKGEYEPTFEIAADGSPRQVRYLQRLLLGFEYSLTRTRRSSPTSTS